MTSESVHLRKARHNKEFLATIDVGGPRFLDWAVTVLFHCALHYVEAWFSRKLNRHFTSHGDRNQAVNRFLVRIAGGYLRLYNRARLARYEQFAMNSTDFHRLKSDHFAPIEHFVTSDLGI
jgi:hypothetical protein